MDGNDKDSIQASVEDLNSNETVINEMYLALAKVNDTIITMSSYNNSGESGNTGNGSNMKVVNQSNNEIIASFQSHMYGADFHIVQESTCPENIIASANTGHDYADNVMWETLRVFDNVDGSYDAICNASRATLFHVGKTMVECTATDKNDNTASCFFEVKVEDHEPPQVICQENVEEFVEVIYGNESKKNYFFNWTMPALSDNVDTVDHLLENITCTNSTSVQIKIDEKMRIQCFAYDNFANICTYS